MLDTYRRLQANGVIGPMQKINAAGQVIVDPGGEIPGTLVPRPFQEFPKMVRRFKNDGTAVVSVVNSKSEELRLIAENPDQDQPRSPLERERDELAKENAQLLNAVGSLEDRLSKVMEQVAGLVQREDIAKSENAASGIAREARDPGVHQQRAAQEPAPAPLSGKGIEALALRT